MSVYGGPKISNDGLVLALDVANPKSILTAVEVLIVAGGGGGGVGGGGAGGLIYDPGFLVNGGTAYNITVGTGGAASTFWGGNGSSGSNSTFGILTAIGGGAGNHNTTSPSGGSGGGGGYLSAGGAGTAGQGFAGGSGLGAPNYPGGGGGGAGGTGQNAVSTSIAGAGGIGLQYSISGTTVYYAGGGGGSTQGGGTGASGGLGGGGAGGGNVNGTAGTSNTGGGGGGGTNLGGAGGSGIVIVRYVGAQKATGGTITSVGEYTIHTFTTPGTFTPNSNWEDLSGLGNNGTLINGFTYISNNRGSLVFNGSNNYITISFATTSGQAVTYTGWLYSTESTATYKNFVDTVSARPMIWWNTSGQIEFDAAYYTTPTVYRNQWVHVALSKPAGSSAASYYVNGVLVGTGTAYTTPTATPTWFNRATAETWKGNCSNIQVYNRALSAAEVQQNYNAIKSRYIQNGDGSSAGNAAPSASYLVSLGITTNGYYYINLPTVGPTQIYCILDPAVDGGGWMVLWGAASGATNYTYSFSASRDDISTSPINGFYSLSYAKRSDINAICTQNKTLVYAGTNSNWLRFDGYIWNSNSHTSGDFRFEFNTSLVTSNGTVDSSVEVGLTNYGVSGGGDFGIAINTNGLDHHASVSYYNLNSGCVNMYLYQYAAGYKVNTTLSGWYNQTSGCTSSNSNELPLLVAMK